MERISRQQMWMEMAEVAARRATCFRGNIGAIVVRNNDVVSMGYNGPPSGEAHCQGNLCDFDSEKGCLRSLHAEANALKRAVHKLKTPLACDLYSTSSPCNPCSMLIVHSGISRFFYRHRYRITTGLIFLLQHDVRVYRVTPAGIIIDEATDHIVDPTTL